MKFTPINDVKPGKVLAKPIYGYEGRVLLQDNVVLKQSYIDKIEALGYNGIYVKDPVTRDIKIKEVVPEEIKQASINIVKKSFQAIERHMSLSGEQIQDIKRSVNDLIREIMADRSLVVDMVDLKRFDDYTFHHSVNVTILSIITGISMGLTHGDLYRLGLGALLHDVGKTRVPKEILNKPGKLNDEEFEIIKKHTQEGYDLLKEKEDIPPTSSTIALFHHEKVNGTGYPHGKKGEETHLFSQIVSVADVYDALISDRPYRKGFTPSEAMEYLLGCSGESFDREVVKHFFRKVAPYPTGTEVLLSDGRFAVVARNYEGLPFRPALRVFRDSHGREMEPYEIELCDPQHLSITFEPVDYKQKNDKLLQR